MRIAHPRSAISLWNTVLGSKEFRGLHAFFAIDGQNYLSLTDHSEEEWNGKQEGGKRDKEHIAGFNRVADFLQSWTDSMRDAAKQQAYLIEAAKARLRKKKAVEQQAAMAHSTQELKKLEPVLQDVRAVNQLVAYERRGDAVCAIGKKRKVRRKRI